MTLTRELPNRTGAQKMAIKRRMTLPTIPGREDPIHKAATKPCSDPAHGAAFIFVHGLGDTAEGLEGMWAGFSDGYHNR